MTHRTWLFVTLTLAALATACTQDTTAPEPDEDSTEQSTEASPTKDTRSAPAPENDTIRPQDSWRQMPNDPIWGQP